MPNQRIDTYPIQPRERGCTGPVILVVDEEKKMRHIQMLFAAALLAGCSLDNRSESTEPVSSGGALDMPASVSEAVVLLLRSSKPSSEVDQALAGISEYENKSMRLQDTIESADGSLHVELEQRFPALGILVYHSDQKFTHASRIPAENETSNK